jgi:deoxycytidine triphosphate deaminase
MADIEAILENIKSIEDVKAGILPGYMIRKLIQLGELKIMPFDESYLTNINYKLHFNNRFRIPKEVSAPIDLSSKESIEAAFTPYIPKETYILRPMESVICQTFEKVGISNNLIAKLENTTQLGRVFINHSAHGAINAGHGSKEPFNIMVEITNLGKGPVKLEAARLSEGKVVGP